MHSFSSLALCAFATLSIAAPTIHHVVHEERNHLPAGWVHVSSVDKDTILPIRIGLTQSNLHNAYDQLVAVSDPDLPTYGKHWTADEVSDFFAPAADTINAVKDWLTSSGIDYKHISQSSNQGWVEFFAPAAKVETLLKAKYNHYAHDSGKMHIGCVKYSVPAHIQKHIDFITPTLHFDTKVKRMDEHQHKKREPKKQGKHGLESAVVVTHNPLLDDASSAPFANSKVKATTADTSYCNSYITANCLRALYKIPVGSKNASSFGIVEYAPQTYLQTDLQVFQTSSYTNDGVVPAGTKPKIVSVDGGYMVPSGNTSASIQAESDLDLEYAMELVYPQTVTLYQVGDNGQNAAAISFNNFLDSIDKSYCTYMGGDAATDEAFPDPNGYAGAAQCGVYTATSVISTSYVYNEYDLSPAYEQRQCNEYMKLGLMGVSVVYASGDNGAAGTGNRCLASGGGYTDGTSGMFNPSFPATCPYVTSVGATQIPSTGSVSTGEVACQSVIYSGGGFSNVFPMPTYQTSAVNTYFRKYKPSYTSATYNNSGTSRGYPDVSANGAGYVVSVDNNLLLASGTSASAPTFASVITLINNERAAVGRGALGFLNTILYKYPGMFNDITSGSNPGCGTNGFTAVTGWDPVTGLGTPNYTKMLNNLRTA